MASWILTPSLMSETTSTMDAKMDTIIEYLERMDKRDRLRTIGGFVRSLLGMIPLLLTLWGVWYMFSHGDEILQKITEQAAHQAMQVSGNAAKDAVKEIDPGLLKQLIPQ